MSTPDWRVQTLPDGRRVEYVYAALIEVSSETFVADVTVLIDGVDVGTVRVEVPKPDSRLWEAGP